MLWASQSATGTNNAHAIASPRTTTAAIPASHRMLRGQAAHCFSTCKTVGDRARPAWGLWQ
jgi:hypothetical protein